MRLPFRRKPEIKHLMTAKTEPRRWWQSRKFRLVCPCGWVSENTYYEKAPEELWFTIRWLMRYDYESHLEVPRHGRR